MGGAASVCLGTRGWAVKGVDNMGMHKVWCVRKYGVTPPHKMRTERRAEGLGVTSHEGGIDARQA